MHPYRLVLKYLWGSQCVNKGILCSRVTYALSNIKGNPEMLNLSCLKQGLV